ncbi:hypothetical protein J1614_001825 [Plenodomus biglobosus]|nr:hypothetical protein J1614_001825 [Plenodomus biglobosus]
MNFRYGNLYFKSDAYPGCEKAQVRGDSPLLTKRNVEERFVIDPVVDREFWHRERASMDIDRGPLKPSGGLIEQTDAPRSPLAHIALYEKFLKVSDILLPKGDFVRPTLWHWDIRIPNIFVKEDSITSLIYWQDTWTGPLSHQARHPRLVRYGGDLVLQLPEGLESMQDEEEKRRIQAWVQKSIVMWSYEKDTKSVNSVLHDVLHIDQAQNRRDTFNFANNTWDEDIIPFRQCLIRVVRHWNEIDDSTPCPIAFTASEIETHHRDGEGWNEAADFWDSLDGFVSRDGWVANENYEQAFDMFAQLREQGLQSLDGQDREEFEQGTRWAERSGENIVGDEDGVCER